MNKRFKIKILIDIIMVVLWLILMDLNLTGIRFHEILAIGILAIIVIHNALNSKWIIGVTKNFSKSSTNALTKTKYILNLLLMILMVIIGISGVFISTDLLPALAASNQELWLYIHRATSYAGLLVISVHVGLHWEMILGALRKAFSIKSKSSLRRVLCSCISLIIMFAGIYSTIKTGFLGKLLPESKNNDKEETQSYQVASSITADTQAGETLEEYLGNQVCTACHRRCSLLSPQCGRGESQAQEATAKFEKTSEISVGSYSSSENSSAIVFTDDEEGSIEATFTDYVPIMGMVICGTYYTLKFIKRKGNQ